MTGLLDCLQDRAGLIARRWTAGLMGDHENAALIGLNLRRATRRRRETGPGWPLSPGAPRPSETRAGQRRHGTVLPARGANTGGTRSRYPRASARSGTTHR